MMQYGEQTITTIDGDGRQTDQVEKIHRGAVAKQFVRQTETVKVKDQSEALAEFLKLMDRQKAGEIHSITFECVPNAHNENVIDRVKKSWICAQA